MIYHTIKGQELLKLYIIFNMLEVAERLVASIGQVVQSSKTLASDSFRTPWILYFIQFQAVPSTEFYFISSSPLFICSFTALVSNKLIFGL